MKKHPKLSPKPQRTPETKRRKNTDLKNPEKRGTIGRNGDAKIMYPRLRLEIHLRYVGAPEQTR